MSRRPIQSSAFTLLELIVVLIILSIITALVVPSMRTFTVGQSTQNSATQIVALARYARTQAITEGSTYRLNFDAGGGAYWLTSATAGVFKDLSSDFGEHFTVASGSSLRTDLTNQTDGTYATFQPTGRTDAAHIWVSDKQGKTLEVACTSATELYRILPPEEMTR